MPASRLTRKVAALPAKLRRLARSLHAGQATPDDAWALAALTPSEGRVYLGMDARDREHAVRVAQALLTDHPQASGELLAASLLHDCGKSVRPYRVLERVAVGLVPGRVSRWVPLGALYVRGFHPELGAALLSGVGARTGVIELVRRHHRPGSDPDAALLHRYDNLE